jgi:PAS domain-containing protein
MADKPTYKELEQRVKDLEKVAFKSKQAEEALRESESTLRRWLETSFTGVLFSNYEGAIEECNDAFLDIIGYTRDFL